MPIKCHNCSREVQVEWNVCPNCGAKIVKPTPEQAKLRRNLEVLELVNTKIKSGVSRTPEGLTAAMRYVDGMTHRATMFSGVFNGFLDHHARMRADPSLLSDEQWVESAHLTVHLLSAVVPNAIDPEKNLFAEYLSIPDGCFDAHFQFIKLQQRVEDLVTRYDRFLESRSLADLEACSESVLEIDKKVHNALDEIDKLIQKIRSPT